MCSKHSFLKFVNLIQIRSYCSSRIKNFKEFKMPVSWGTIFGKWYAPYDTQPILALHGWQDNCEVFDRLIPLLPEHISILSIDFPGHGLSSHYPRGYSYKGIDGTIVIRLIYEYLKFSKLSMMGHSMGGINSFVYAMLYPETVDHLILLDGLYPLPFIHESKNWNIIGQNIDKFIKSDNTPSKPSAFALEDLQRLIYKATNGTVPPDICNYLLKRNTKEYEPHSNKYYFKKDIRLKYINASLWNHSDLIEHSSQITCPICVIAGTNNSIIRHDDKFWEIYNAMKKRNQIIQFHQVKGGHHFFLSDPDPLKDILSTFFKDYHVGEKCIPNKL